MSEWVALPKIIKSIPFLDFPLIIRCQIFIFCT